MNKFYLLSLLFFVYGLKPGTASAQTMDWVNLQWPPTINIAANTTEIVYTQGYEAGVTEAAGAGAGISVWIGISPVGAAASSDPATWTNWIPASFNFQTGNNDEFSAGIGNNLAPGTYRYASRWQLNGGPYRYGGLAGFWNAASSQSGVLTVSSPVNDDCFSASTISSTQIAAGNFGATQSMIANPACASTSSMDVWYTYVISSGNVSIISLANVSNFDPILEAFTGNCGTLVSLGCTDDAGVGAGETKVINGLPVGQRVYVRVSGKNGTFGSFNIAVASSVLPVTIEFFNGSKQNSDNRLDWKINCYNSPSVTMVLERSSNGRDFNELKRFTESATRCQAPFETVDNNPLSGINYYRLKTIDSDGKISLSNIVALSGSSKGFAMLAMLPNPVAEQAILRFTSAEKTMMTLVITDVAGKQLSSQKLQVLQGINQVSLDLQHIPAGTYQVSGITTNGERKTLSFVKP